MFPLIASARTIIVHLSTQRTKLELSASSLSGTRLSCCVHRALSSSIPVMDRCSRCRAERFAHSVLIVRRWTKALKEFSAYLRIILRHFQNGRILFYGKALIGDRFCNGTVRFGDNALSIALCRCFS